MLFPSWQTLIQGICLLLNPVLNFDIWTIFKQSRRKNSQIMRKGLHLKVHYRARSTYLARPRCLGIDYLNNQVKKPWWSCISREDTRVQELQERAGVGLCPQQLDLVQQTPVDGGAGPGSSSAGRSRAALGLHSAHRQQRHKEKNSWSHKETF